MNLDSITDLATMRQIFEESEIVTFTDEYAKLEQFISGHCYSQPECHAAFSVVIARLGLEKKLALEKFNSVSTYNDFKDKAREIIEQNPHIKVTNIGANLYSSGLNSICEEAKLDIEPCLEFLQPQLVDSFLDYMLAEVKAQIIAS